MYVDSEDIEHRTKLNTEELAHLQNEQQMTLVEKMSSEEEDGKRRGASFLIKERCAKWGDVQSL